MDKLEKAYKELQGVDHKNYSYCEPADKDKLHRVGRKFLRALSEALDLAGARVDSNMGGIAVSGEMTLHGDTLYVQLSDSWNGPDHLKLMIRGVEHSKDYRGLNNMFCRVDNGLVPIITTCNQAINQSIKHQETLQNENR